MDWYEIHCRSFFTCPLFQLHPDSQQDIFLDSIFGVDAFVRIQEHTLSEVSLCYQQLPHHPTTVCLSLYSQDAFSIASFTHISRWPRILTTMVMAVTHTPVVTMATLTKSWMARAHSWAAKCPLSRVETGESVHLLLASVGMSLRPCMMYCVPRQLTHIRFEDP